jgi:hypothetical protein
MDSMFWAGVLIGLFAGTLVGFVAAGLCGIMAGREPDERLQNFSSKRYRVRQPDPDCRECS